MSDNAVQLPGIEGGVGAGPVGFEPGMFHPQGSRDELGLSKVSRS